MISVWDRSSDSELNKIESKEAFIDWKKDNESFKRYYYFYDADELEYLLKEVGFEVITATKKENKKNSYQHSAKNIIFLVKKI